MYGERGSQPHLTATTELAGLENARQVRSNTYDNPVHEATPAANGEKSSAVTPMYETIQTAKQEMVNAGGPPVLNPVYGPSSTPKTPTSPHPQPSKAASNPVYSETGINSHQFSDVSALNPVYAAVGKPSSQSVSLENHYSNPYSEMHAGSSVPPPKGCIAPALESLSADPHYSSPYSQLQVGSTLQMSSDVIPNSKRADPVDCPPPVPVYEELQSARRSDTVGMANQNLEQPMIRNESYGVIGMVEIHKASKPPLHDKDCTQNGTSTQL